MPVGNAGTVKGVQFVPSLLMATIKLDPVSMSRVPAGEKAVITYKRSGDVKRVELLLTEVKR